MTNSCELSRNTESYLERYNSILARMASSMEGAELTNSVSGNFISQMLPHHRAAIEMSENLLRYTTDISLQRIADNIISEQTRSIEAMTRIRRGCSATMNLRQSATRYNECVGRIVETMLSSMESAPAVNSIDCCFIGEMLPHHEGAVKMSRLALQFSLCPGLVPILNDIIRTQSRGIRELRDLKRALCRAN